MNHPTMSKAKAEQAQAALVEEYGYSGREVDATPATITASVRHYDIEEEIGVLVNAHRVGYARPLRGSVIA